MGPRLLQHISAGADYVIVIPCVVRLHVEINHNLQRVDYLTYRTMVKHFILSTSVWISQITKKLVFYLSYSLGSFVLKFLFRKSMGVFALLKQYSMIFP